MARKKERRDNLRLPETEDGLTIIVPESKDEEGFQGSYYKRRERSHFNKVRRRRRNRKPR